MRIRTKLACGFGAISLLMLLVIVVSLRSTALDHQQFLDYVQGVNARAHLAEQVRQAVGERAIAARNLVLLTDETTLQAERAVVTAAHQRVGEALAGLRALVDRAQNLPPEVPALVARMESIEAQYAPVALAIVEMASTGRRDEAVRRMNEQCRPLLAALLGATQQYATLTEQRSKQILAESETNYSAQFRLLLAAAVLVVLLSAAAAWQVTQAITRPVARALSIADAVADGDLTRRAEGVGNDEVARLLAALGRMTGNLEGLVSHVRSSSDCIATGVAQVAGGNADLSHRTERQAAALQETAASMEQLNATVRQNADNAMQANQLAVGASSVASRAGDVVGQVVSRMKAINDSSRRIADIIGVIDGIAFQTNILALNASVEAARAGEQGRGFAVVAGEVRNLASRSAEAAREIRTLIGASVEQVDQGQALVDRAGETMEEVVTSIRRVADIVAEISAASQEQSSGVRQVGEAITQMDQATQQNAALVEQSAAASESLNEQTRGLLAAVGRFRTA